MFVDSVDIFIASGKGGPGAVSFRREKYVLQGGPDGGDGGDGGDVYIEVDNNTDTLSRFRGARHYKAKNGQPGGSRRCSGKKGENIVIKVPLGTQVFDYQSGELIVDMDIYPKSVCLLKGGKGGLGNAHFKNSTNQAPIYAQNGIKGIEQHIALELKIIADVGLVGYPNVGKSTLISVLSNAKPQIANYAFTTIVPNLGVVDIDEYFSFVMADIPGIIEGASEGKGLGIEFLRHIERNKVLLFVLDATQDVRMQFESLRIELKHFNPNLLERPFGIVLSKCDIVSKEELSFSLTTLCDRFVQMTESQGDEVWFSPFFDAIQSNHCLLIEDTPCFIMPISSATSYHIVSLKNYLAQILKNIK